MPSKSCYALLNALVTDIEREADYLSECFDKKGRLLTEKDKSEAMFVSAAFRSIVCVIYTRIEGILLRVLSQSKGSVKDHDLTGTSVLEMMSQENASGPRLVGSSLGSLLLDISNFSLLCRRASAEEICPEDVLKKCSQCIEAVSLFRRDFDQFSESFFDVPRPGVNSNKPS